MQIVRSGVTKLQAGLRIFSEYLLAGIVAIVAGSSIGDAHPYLVVAAADFAGTAVIFAFSRIHRNSSVYDPYWSVAPLPIAAYFAVRAGALTPRLAIAALLIAIWGARLTYNWWRRWQGWEHEDWRYVDLERKTGRWYWTVSFLGIHLFPSVLVYLGCLPLWSIATSTVPLGPLDLLALLFTAAAIAIEGIADAQLHRHANGPSRSELLDRGLWSWSRHPNYLGEIMIWWGLLWFGLAAGGREPLIFSGAIAMTMLFLFVSIPMVERRCRERRPDYPAYAERTSMLIPWPPKKR